MEKANELNQATIEKIDASPPLLEMENKSQETGAKLALPPSNSATHERSISLTRDQVLLEG